MRGSSDHAYLDRTHAELIAGNQYVWLFCACGRHAKLGPNDFAQRPGWSLYTFIAHLRCTGCGARGDIPQVRVSSVEARWSGAGAHAGHIVDEPKGDPGPIQTTHQRRRSRRRKRMKRPQLLAGKALKDALMPRARELARSGHHKRWLDVVLQFEDWDEQSALRHYLTDREQDELEMISASARRWRVARLAPCCPAGARGLH